MCATHLCLRDRFPVHDSYGAIPMSTVASPLRYLLAVTGTGALRSAVSFSNSGTRRIAMEAIRGPALSPERVREGCVTHGMPPASC